MWEPVTRIIAAWQQTAPEQIETDWVPVTRMIGAARSFQAASKTELETLLRTSYQLLSPLEDPFWTDFGLHRWLHSSREETYSDWLAWILQGLENAAEVFEVFDLGVTGSADWPNGSITREKSILGGRLDIVLRWPGKGLLVVEVKVTDEESADIEKQNGYRKWMDTQRGEPRKEALLLTLNANPGDSEGGFQRRDWRQICLRLRSLAARALGAKPNSNSRINRSSVVRAALLLAFVGAVEQNLLGMPSEPLRLMNEGHLLNIHLMLGHIRDFTGAHSQ